MPFPNGFKGFLSVMPTCIFAMAGSENAGLVAAETANPKRSVPKAVGSIWLRLSLFYLMGSLMITINVSPLNEDLFGGKGTNASPFVIAYRDAGIPALAHMMNAIILLSVISTGTISGYAGSRTVMGLAYLNMAPAKFKSADKLGRPWWGLLPTFILGAGLGYINVSESGADVFGWFSNLTSLFTLFGWYVSLFPISFLVFFLHYYPLVIYVYPLNVPPSSFPSLSWGLRPPNRGGLGEAPHESHIAVLHPPHQRPAHPLLTESPFLFSSSTSHHTNPSHQGHDLSRSHPVPLGMGRPRPYTRTTPLEILDVPVRSMVGAQHVHYPHHRPILPRSLASGWLLKRKRLLRKLCFHHRGRGHLSRCKSLL